jgi:hypothetical protein
MHSALLERLASQHAAELLAAAATRSHRAGTPEPGAATAAPPGEPRPSIAQRVGWALIQAGLWLAVRSARSRGFAPPVQAPASVTSDGSPR